MIGAKVCFPDESPGLHVSSLLQGKKDPERNKNQTSFSIFLCNSLKARGNFSFLCLKLKGIITTLPIFMSSKTSNISSPGLIHINSYFRKKIIFLQYSFKNRQKNSFPGIVQMRTSPSELLLCTAQLILPTRQFYLQTNQWYIPYWSLYYLDKLIKHPAI